MSNFKLKQRFIPLVVVYVILTLVAWFSGAGVIKFISQLFWWLFSGIVSILIAFDKDFRKGLEE